MSLFFKHLKTEELTRLYFFTMLLKNEVDWRMHSPTMSDAPAAFIGETEIDYEGLVRSNKFGSFKLVHRLLFSSANFNNMKHRSADS